MLKRLDLKATVAIITGYVGKNYDRHRVQPCPLMGISHLEELLAEGWEIASHGVSHRHFTTLTDEEVLMELLQSKEWIIENLGVEPKKFAFPNDLATPEHIELAKKHYEYIRPIPPTADVIIHKIILNERGRVFYCAGNINPELQKILNLDTVRPDPKLLVRPPTHSPEPDRWIFLTGCNNSGTTLLDYLLGVHPDIDPLIGEIHQIQVSGIVTTYPRNFILPSPAVIRRPDGKRLNRVWTENLPVFREPIVEVPILRRSMKLARKTTDGIYTMGKSQDWMVKMLWAQKRLPRSHFGIIVRNGYCVAEGIRRRLRARVPMTVAHAARHWNKAHVVMLNALKDPKNYAVIRYEDFCRDPADMLNQLIEFFDLPPFDYTPILDKPIPIFKGFRRALKIRDMNSESLARLSEQDIADISREARDMLKRFGYPILGE